LRTGLGLRRTSCGPLSVASHNALHVLPAACRDIKPLMAPVTARTVVRRVSAPALHRKRTVPSGTARPRQFLRVRTVVRPTQCLVPAINTAVLASPAPLTDNAIVRRAVCDAVAAPAWILGPALILSIDGMNVAMPTQPRLMHPAQAVHDLAAAVTAGNAASLDHPPSMHGNPASRRRAKTLHQNRSQLRACTLWLRQVVASFASLVDLRGSGRQIRWYKVPNIARGDIVDAPGTALPRHQTGVSRN
jgi:hypothetical protein